MKPPELEKFVLRRGIALRYGLTGKTRGGQRRLMPAKKRPRIALRGHHRRGGTNPRKYDVAHAPILYQTNPALLGGFTQAAKRGCN